MIFTMKSGKSVLFAAILLKLFFIPSLAKASVHTSGVISINSSGNYNAVLMEDHSIWAWGQNSFKQATYN